MPTQTVNNVRRYRNGYQHAGLGAKRRRDADRTLAILAARLVDSQDIESAVAATLRDIGEEIDAGCVDLWTYKPDMGSFTRAGSWSQALKPPERDAQELTADEARRLAARLRGQGHLEVSAKAPLELEGLRRWYRHTLHVFPLYEAGELAGLLFCCDASWLADAPEESLRFVQAACGLLSGMLRIHQMMDTLEQRVAAQTREVAAFFNMTILAGTSQTMTDTLASALSMLSDIGHCDAMCVHVYSSDAEQLELAHHMGLGAIEHSHLLTIAADSALCLRLQQAKTPVFANDPSGFMPEVYLPGFQCYLGAPMAVRGVVQGVVSCYWQPARSVSINQVTLLTALVEQLGMILENQRLYRNAQEMAVLHERQRMARDLHDSVTQSLYCLTLFARAGRAALEDGDGERVTDYLAQVEETARLSLTEMRLLLYELRPQALESQGLVEALRTRLDLVERRLKIQVKLQSPVQIDLARDVEEALYYVTIEALNNVLKHANAGLVTIHLQRDGDRVELLVSDDGIGFDVQQAAKGMGLHNMRERLAALGGTLRIESRRKKGTQIRACVGAGLRSEQAGVVDGNRPKGDVLWLN